MKEKWKTSVTRRVYQKKRAWDFPFESKRQVLLNTTQKTDCHRKIAEEKSSSRRDVFLLVVLLLCIPRPQAVQMRLEKRLPLAQRHVRLPQPVAHIPLRRVHPRPLLLPQQLPQGPIGQHPLPEVLHRTRHIILPQPGHGLIRRRFIVPVQLIERVQSQGQGHRRGHRVPRQPAPQRISRDVIALIEVGGEAGHRGDDHADADGLDDHVLALH